MSQSRTNTRNVRRLLAGALVAALGVALAAPIARAADWPQYRGPNHDGRSPETGIAEAWRQAAPKVLWRAPVGEGFGAVSVVGARAYLTMERGKQEVCVALDANSGKEVWSAPIDKTIFEGQGGNGPRTTPAVSEGRVYVLGTYLKLLCLDASDGKVVWSKDLAAAHGGQIKTRGIDKWGNAASPVVEGGLVLVAGGGPGQALIAFDKKTGEVRWKGQDDLITHATATPATIHGVRQVIFFTQMGLVSVKPADGAVLWRYKFPWSVSTASSPIVGGKDGDIVYCSAGYGVGAGAVKVSKDGDELTATELWRTPGENMNHWTTPVHHEGHLYGIYGFKELGTGPLTCLDIEAGKVKWERPGFGSGGGTILVDGHVLVQSDSGPVTLVKATPEDYQEVGKVTPFGGKCWTMAVIADGRVFARNTKEVVCLEVTKATRSARAE